MARVTEVLGHVAVVEDGDALLAFGWGITSQWALDMGVETMRQRGLASDRLRVLPAAFAPGTRWPVRVESDEDGVAWRAGHRPPADVELAAACGRAGDFMLATSPSGRLHAFEPHRLLSRCGAVVRSMATPSTYRNEIAAVRDRVDVCGTCFREVAQIRIALRTPEEAA